MYNINPYIQAGWYDNSGDQSPAFTVNSTWNTIPSPIPSPTPSLFGALPLTHPSQNGAPAFLAFIFTSFSSDITNSVVLGPHNQCYFKIVTKPSTPGFTIVQDGQGKDIAAIGWQRHAFVEIRGIVARQTTKQWIGLSADNAYRIMEAQGKRFFWVPRQNVICLYAAGLSSSEPLAKITEGRGTVLLEVSTGAFQAGLLEVCAVVTVLFGSGRNLE